MRNALGWAFVIALVIAIVGIAVLTLVARGLSNAPDGER